MGHFSLQMKRLTPEGEQDVSKASGLVRDRDKQAQVWPGHAKAAFPWCQPVDQMLE